MKGRKLNEVDIYRLDVGDYVVIEPTIEKYKDQIGAVLGIEDTGRYANGSKWVITQDNWTFPDDMEICDVYEYVDEN